MGSGEFLLDMGILGSNGKMEIGFSLEERSKMEMGLIWVVLSK